MSCQFDTPRDKCPLGVTIEYTITAKDMGDGTQEGLMRFYNSISNQFKGLTKGLLIKDNSNQESKGHILPCDIPGGFNSAFSLKFAVELVAIRFNVSFTRVCAPIVTIIPEKPTDKLDSITISFKLTDTNLLYPPLSNDYLPAGILGLWISDWLKNVSRDNPDPPPNDIPEKYLLNNPFTPLYLKSISQFTSSIISNESVKYNPLINIEKYEGVSAKPDPGYSAVKSSCLKSCSTSTDVYTLTFTINAPDVSKMAPGIGEFWTQLQNMSIYGLVQKPSYNSGADIDMESATGIPTFKVPDNCTLTTDNNGGVWIFLASFAKWFGFSVSRLCNVFVTPDPDVSNITGVKIIVTISPPNENTKEQNDDLSAKCIGEWMIEFLKQYNPEITDTDPPFFAAKTIGEVRTKCTGFSPEINENIKNIEKYTNMSKNILSGIKFTDVSGYYSENYSAISGNVGTTLATNTTVSPSTLYEYLFMYCYPVCFIGSIFFAITSVVSIDPSTIIANKNLSIGINVYILVCSAIAMFSWYNMDNPILVSSVLNPKVIRITLN